MISPTIPLRLVGLGLATALSISACSRSSDPKTPAIEQAKTPDRGKSKPFAQQKEPSAAEASGQVSPVFETYLRRPFPARRVLEAPALISANLQTDPMGCRQLATQVLKHDLWEGEELEVDGDIEVHISAESFEAAREVFRLFAASYPAAAAEVLNDVPGEIRETAIKDWAKSAPGLPLDQLKAFLAPLDPDQQKAAGWLLVEETYYTDPSKVPALAGLSQLLPENPMNMMSKISQYRPTREPQ